jgi:hypothetical protein
MKNRTFALVALVVMANPLATAGPFGLSKGLKKEDYPGVLEKVNDMTYTAKTVPNPSELIKDYMLTFGSTQGLAKITCLTPPIATSVYGESVIEEFNKLETALSKKYGKSTKYDLLSAGSIWNEPRDWMMGLMKKERDLAAFWQPKKGERLPDDLTIISIKAVAISTEKAVIVVSYEFENFVAVAEELQKKRAGGL